MTLATRGRNVVGVGEEFETNGKKFEYKIFEKINQKIFTSQQFFSNSFQNNLKIGHIFMYIVILENTRLVFVISLPQNKVLVELIFYISLM